MFQLGSPSEPLRTAKCQPLQTLKSPRYAIRVCKTREREREGEISPHAHNWGGVGRRGESARRRRGQGATITCLDSGGTSALIGKGLGVVWL